MRVMGALGGGRGAFLALWLLTSLVFTGVGAWVVYEQEVALRTYEPTDATVLGTEVEREVDRDPDPDEPDSVTYTPIVEYRYEVDGETYTDTTVFPGGTGGSGDRGRAESIVSGYERGQAVTAYYDPGNPDDAYLEQKREVRKFLFPAFGLLCLGVGVLVWRRSGGDGGTTADTGRDTDVDGTATPETVGADHGAVDGTADTGPDPDVGDTGTESDTDADRDGVEYPDWDR